MIFGIDVSKWQGDIDWPKLAAAGVKYAGIRFSIGDYYIDVNAARNYDGAAAVGIIPFPYHVVHFGVGDEKQINHFEVALQGRRPVLSILDCENFQGQKLGTKDHMGRIARYCRSLIDDKIHSAVAYYTNRAFWNTYLPLEGWGGSAWKNSPLWVASYGANDGTVPPDPYPSLPNSWDFWKVWQYTDKGATFDAVQSASLDYNLMDDTFYGNLRIQSGLPEPGGPSTPPPPPPSNSELEARVAALEADVADLGLAIDSLEAWKQALHGAYHL